MVESLLVAIVDDDESIRRATRSLLRAAGFATAAFTDAESFLRSAMRVSTACLVADMRMPGMNGLELYRTLVSSGERIPTVLITAYPEDVTRSRATEAGISCLLGKPFSPDELLECVQKALATPRSARPIPKS